MRVIHVSVCIYLTATAGLFSGIPEEFRVKREAVYEFVKKPVVARDGDIVTIAFESKAFCDATVAIENANGRIIRHLASGVLGPKAPPPFKPNSKTQTLVWDGKDDQEKYIDDKDSIVVRVSLGLKPRFERSLLWCPQKRVGTSNSPRLAAAPEGVYVFEGEGVDILRLFDHDGNYVRTIYPFAADKLGDVKGLKYVTFPQSGKTLPVKSGPKHYATLLTSGGGMRKAHDKYGAAGSALAVAGDRIAIVGTKTSRLCTDGTSGAFDVPGPLTGYSYKTRKGMIAWRKPRSVAMSPDGKWLYLAYGSLQGIARVAYDAATDSPPEVFAGKMSTRERGNGPNQFNAPTGVACDAKGRVYVADYGNDRVQVFTPDGKLFKSLRTFRPAVVQVHQKNGEIYVFSYCLKVAGPDPTIRVKPRLTRFGPVEKPEKIAEYPLQLNQYCEATPGTRYTGGEYRIALDSFTDEPTIWIVPGRPAWQFGWMGELRGKGVNEDQVRTSHIQLRVIKDGKLVTKRDFGREAVKKVLRSKPGPHSKQRLIVNPVDGMLYVWEGDSGVNKSCRTLMRVNPDTGDLKLVTLPMTAEDLVFDLNGLVYLRTDKEVVRYDLRSRREVPYDYGESRKGVGFDGARGSMNTRACIVLPSKGRPADWHMGGMDINANGHLVVACYNRERPPRRELSDMIVAGRYGKSRGSAGRAYTPPVYPGRYLYGEIHIFDKHGKAIRKDVLPGMGVPFGVMIDRHDDVYALTGCYRKLDGKPYVCTWASTLFKMRPGKGRLLSTNRAAVQLPREARPKRPPDMNVYAQGDVWIEGAEWIYGGVGFNGADLKGGGCVCWTTRCDLDYFGRVFAPEIDHFTVAVLDSNGNVILRVGRYGNLDEGKPLIAEGSPPNPRSIGGDEVALFHAPYVGTHTDRRLFITDAGNRRIVSVKLGYHAEETVALEDVPDPSE